MLARLDKSQADRVLVVAFDHIKPNVFHTLAENLTNVAANMFEVLLERQDRESLECLAEALVPRVPLSPRLLKEVAMFVRERKEVLETRASVPLG